MGNLVQLWENGENTKRGVYLLEIKKVDSRGRVVLPSYLREDEVSIMKVGNRGIIIPKKDPYEHLRGKFLAPPLKEMRDRTENLAMEEAKKDAK